MERDNTQPALWPLISGRMTQWMTHKNTLLAWWRWRGSNQDPLDAKWGAAAFRFQEAERRNSGQMASCAARRVLCG